MTIDNRVPPAAPTRAELLAAAERESVALGYLYDVVRRAGWTGWHPEDYDPTDDDLLRLIFLIREDTGRAVADWIGEQFGEGVRARFEREFPLRNRSDNGDWECRAATRQRTLAEECHWCHAPIVGEEADQPTGTVPVVPTRRRSRCNRRAVREACGATCAGA